MNYSKNDELNVHIDSYGNSGEGIAHVDGYTLFIKGALVGEDVRVSLTKLKKNYGYARLISVENESPDRVTPLCPVARQCGGCELWHMSYDEQLRFKEQKVRETLERIGGVSFAEGETELHQIIGMDEPKHYRNKAQFPVGTDKEGNAIAGFYVAHTHQIIPCKECLIQHPEINQVLDTILDAIDTKHAKSLRHVYIRRGYQTGQIMVVLVMNRKLNDKNTEIITREMAPVFDRLKSIPEMTSIGINENTADTNVILGEKTVFLYGNDYIEDRIGELTFRISHRSFYQINPVQMEKLYQTALDFAGLTGNEVVWDLYGGIGTIGLFFSKNAKRVVGVEIVPDAVENAKENARINNIDNTIYYCGPAEKLVDELMDGGEDFPDGSYDRGIPLPDVVVVDPPRKGCDEALLEAIKKASPAKLVYVSCDPATLARDISRLADHYRTDKVRVVDQFPHSRHVETAALLTRIG